MLSNSIETKKYRGAHIHIINYYQEFIIVVFYRGKFYQFKSATDKRGEYTNEEYLVVLDAIREDAKKFIDAIKIQRSFKYKIKLFIKNFHVRKKRKTIGIPEGAGKNWQRPDGSERI